MGFSFASLVSSLGVVFLGLVIASSPANASKANIRDGIYKIKAVHSIKCLGMYNRSVADSAGLIQYTCNKNIQNQEFYVFRVKKREKIYSIANVNSKKCIDVGGGSKSDGAKVQQFSCARTLNQLFVIEHVNGGKYTIKARHSMKCLDVSNASKENNGKVHQWNCKPNAKNQMFEFLSTKVFDLKKTKQKKRLNEPPELTKHKLPIDGHTTKPVLYGSSYLPFTLVNVKNPAFFSTYYRLEHHRGYIFKASLSQRNETSAKSKMIKTVQTGMEQSKQDEFGATTGLTVSTTTSAEAGPFSAEVTAEVSVELGFTSTSTFTESLVVAQTDEYTIPAHSTIATWVPLSRYILKRKSGTSEWVEVKSWDSIGKYLIRKQYQEKKKVKKK